METERLILRPFTVEDAHDLFEYTENPTVHCFECMRITSLDEAVKQAKERAAKGEYYFAIVLKENGKVIGEIDAMPERSALDDEEAACDTFSPCWMLNPAYQGKGYAYEAAKAFFGYLFGEKGARRIYAYTEDTNIRSQHLCEKLGMRREGLFREFVTFVNDADGKPIYENTYQYAILKKEWDERDLKVKTERLTVRAASNLEMRGLVENETDPELKQAYGEMLGCCLDDPGQRKWYAAWFIELEDGTRVGDLCFKGLSDDGRVEIGYGLLEEFRGKGYATEAVKAITNWALDQPGVTAVEAETEEDNHASQNVLKKAGFAPTGTRGEEGPRFILTKRGDD